MYVNKDLPGNLHPVSGNEHTPARSVFTVLNLYADNTVKAQRRNVKCTVGWTFDPQKRIRKTRLLVCCPKFFRRLTRLVFKELAE